MHLFFKCVSLEREFEHFYRWFLDRLPTISFNLLQAQGEGRTGLPVLLCDKQAPAFNLRVLKKSLI